MSTLRQRVALSRKLSGRSSRFAVSAWLGGYAAQQDGARLSVEFLDGEGTPRGLVVLGPVTAEERATARVPSRCPRAAPCRRAAAPPS